MNCPTCSTENVDRARFCRACGASLTITTPPPVDPLPAYQPPAPHDAPVAIPSPYQPPTMFQPARSSAVVGVARRQRRKRVLLIVLGTMVAVGAVVGGVAALGGTKDAEPKTIATVAATPTVATLPPSAGTLAPSTVATEPPQTTTTVVIASTAAPPVTTVIEPSTTEPIETTPPVTTAPPPPVPTELTQDEATAMFQGYLNLVTTGAYPDAWPLLTPRYQVKYLGYDNFVRFWNTVNGAGIRDATSIAASPGAQTLHCHLWFGRRVDGTTSYEVVDIDFIRDPSTGAIMIDDYRFIGKE